MTTPNFFQTNSPYLNHPLLTPQRTAQEADFIHSKLELGKGLRVLDVGCAFGRHSIALAQQGCVVTGIDPALAMVTAAQQAAVEANVTATFQQISAEDFHSDLPFAAAICLFTTLGQIGAAGDNLALLKRVYALLKTGGYFMVEVPQRAVQVATLRPADRFGNDTTYTEVTRQFDAVENTIIENFNVVSPELTQHFLLRYRVFSSAELSTHLSNAGFTITHKFSDYNGNPLQADSPRMLFICQKQEL